jgi:hypothetical protein
MRFLHRIQPAWKTASACYSFGSLLVLVSTACASAPGQPLSNTTGSFAAGVPFPMTGFERASLFNKCWGKHKTKRHWVDVVYSARNPAGAKNSLFDQQGMYTGPGTSEAHGHAFAFFDNVKAGSTTIRNRLNQVWHATWDSPQRKKTPSHKRKRTCSTDFSADQMDDVFKFGFARNPVAKYVIHLCTITTVVARLMSAASPSWSDSALLQILRFSK